jgi:ABC-type polar amino acid transport system ATPase subunit
MEIIRVENLHKNFGKLEVLKGINFSAQKGEVITIIGPSGSGKSTLLRCMNGLEEADEGQVITDARIGMVFQSFNLFPHMSVIENLIEAPIIVKKMPKSDVERIADDLLAKVGLMDKREAYPCQLSGGQKQRVAIARALVNNPSIILADEPTGNLDSKTSVEIMNIFNKIHSEGNTVVLVTHENDIAAYAKRVVRLRDGLIESDEFNEKIMNHDVN